MAFLEIVTRHLATRPGLLADNMASLAGQTDPDWEQVLLMDRKGRGIGWSCVQLAEYGPKLTGEYIWILDDDDVCVRPTLVEELKYIAAKYEPDVIFLRMDHGPRGVLPDEAYWGSAPIEGHIGVSAYVVRRQVWQRHADAWRSARYASDYDFIKALIEDDCVFAYWHDVIASRVQQIGLGQPEVV